ncbi:MAG TPA: anti-sigma F factor antagonist [Cytophagales bacterium]|jgi:anti-sigma B factor antagonist|nr:anti-sigma F factor antagonist [Cytophagales bacterium]
MVEISSEVESDICFITVKGDVDASSSIHLDQSINEATRQFKKILIDCQHLNYISSAGLGVFMSYINDLEEKGIKMILFNMSPKVHHVFEILGLDQLLKITGTEAEAKEIVNGV